MTSTDTLAMYDTPVLIDTRLAEVYSAIGRLSEQRERASDLIRRINEVQGTYRASEPWFSLEKREEAAETVSRTHATIAEFKVEARQLEALYTGWTRYWIVTNSNGHIHSSTSCATCFPTTQYGWLTEYSGMASQDLVALAGEAACTVCFPDAPVAVLGQKSQIRYTTAEQRERAAERDAKRSASDEAKVVVPGYQGWGADRSGVKVFKTERAATNDIASNLSSLCNYGVTHPSAAKWLNDIEVVRAALSTKGVDYDYDKALASARKKYTAEVRKFAKSPQGLQHVAAGFDLASEEPNF